MISEIVDGTLPGGQPKWIELHNSGPGSVDLAAFELAYYAGGNTVANGVLPLAGSLAAGAFHIVAFEPPSASSNFAAVYHSAPDTFFGSFINGDDVVALRDASTSAVHDVYGQIGLDGTGTFWDYTDSYAFRCTTVASATFSAADWTFGGPNALEDPGGDVEEEENLWSFTHPRFLQSCPGCFSHPDAYCTSGLSSSGCRAVLSSLGAASATSVSGFTVTVSQLDGGRSGLFFYGQNGRQANRWGNGASYQCVLPPVRRGALDAGNGTIGVCDGVVAHDLNARWCPSCPKPGHAPSVGTVLQLQYWYRDAQNTSNKTTSLSNALEVDVCP